LRSATPGCPRRIHHRCIGAFAHRDPICADVSHLAARYRLNVFLFEIPSLRERSDDIPMLVKYLIDPRITLFILADFPEIPEGS